MKSFICRSWCWDIRRIIFDTSISPIKQYISRCRPKHIRFNDIPSSVCHRSSHTMASTIWTDDAEFDALLSNICRISGLNQMRLFLATPLNLTHWPSSSIATNLSLPFDISFAFQQCSSKLITMSGLRDLPASFQG